MKGRLIIGVPLLAIFALLCGIGFAVQTHAWFEEWDTVAWHQREREEAAAENSAIDLSTEPPPHSELGRAKTRLTSIGQQLLLTLVMGFFFGGLSYLGYRKLKSWPG